MHGALCTLQERTGLRTKPVDAAATDPLLALAQCALGDGAYAAAVVDGQRLTTEQAVAEGLAWLASA